MTNNDPNNAVRALEQELDDLSAAAALIVDDIRDLHENARQRLDMIEKQVDASAQTVDVLSDELTQYEKKFGDAFDTLLLDEAETLGAAETADTEAD